MGNLSPEMMPSGRIRFPARRSKKSIASLQAFRKVTPHGSYIFWLSRKSLPTEAAVIPSTGERQKPAADELTSGIVLVNLIS